MLFTAPSLSVFLFLSCVCSYVTRACSCSILICERKGIFLNDLQALDSGWLRAELSSHDRTDLTAFFDPTTGCFSTNDTNTGNPVEHSLADDPTEGFTLNVTATGDGTLTNSTRSYELQLRNYDTGSEFIPPLLFVSLRLERAYIIYKDSMMEFTESALVVLNLASGDVAYSSFEYPVHAVDDVTGTIQVYPDIQLISMAGATTDCVTSVFASFNETSVSVVSYESVEPFDTNVVAGILPPFFRAESMFNVVDRNKCAEDCSCKFEGTAVVITERSLPDDNNLLNSTTFDQRQLAHLYETGSVCFGTVVTSGVGRRTTLTALVVAMVATWSV